jgi:hypothetical protein
VFTGKMEHGDRKEMKEEAYVNLSKIAIEGI